MNKHSQSINNYIKELENKKMLNTDDISDGSHTFGELYEHRILLYLNLLKMLQEKGLTPYWSSKHDDGGGFEGWVLVGVVLDNGEQISYHLPERYSDILRKLFGQPLDRAIKWDGHRSDDILDRLKNMLFV